MSKAIEWVGCWSDESETILDLVRSLKAAGVRAKRDHSPYVGHHTLKVDKRDVKKAKKYLREFELSYGAYIADECLDADGPYLL